MPSWAKLQFLNSGVAKPDLERVLGRITSLQSWADAWEQLGAENEQSGRASEARGDHRAAAASYLAASAAYNFSQYVIFMDIGRKRALHEACVRTYAEGAPYYDPPATRFEVMFRRRPMVGYLRVPRGATGPVPVVVMFNGTNAVKEELHWWSEAFLGRGLASITFDGPGMGQTFNRLSQVGEPRSMGVAILNHIETRPDLDPGAVGFVGLITSSASRRRSTPNLSVWRRRTMVNVSRNSVMDAVNFAPHRARHSRPMIAPTLWRWQT